MAAITISLTGSSLVANSSKTYTISDADLQSLMNWVESAYFPPAASPTDQQILLAWIQGFIDSTKASIQVFQSRIPIPPPITIS